MPTAFARAEQRLNAAVEQHLANTTATHQGGAAFPVLFNRAHVDPLGGGEVDAVMCVAGFRAVHAPALVRGGVLVIGGVSHRVVSDVTPDATGWVAVELAAV